MRDEERSQTANAPSLESTGRSEEGSSESQDSRYRFIISCGLEKEDIQED
jgi:hypothetical protein